MGNVTTILILIAIGIFVVAAISDLAYKSSAKKSGINTKNNPRLDRYGGNLKAREIASVKVLGTRTAMQGDAFYMKNFGVTQLKIEYTDGSFVTKEVKSNSPEMQFYSKFI